jgi:hypothetical protein
VCASVPKVRLSGFSTFSLGLFGAAVYTPSSLCVLLASVSGRICASSVGCLASVLHPGVAPALGPLAYARSPLFARLRALGVLPLWQASAGVQCSLSFEPSTCRQAHAFVYIHLCFVGVHITCLLSLQLLTYSVMPSGPICSVMVPSRVVRSARPLAGCMWWGNRHWAKQQGFADVLAVSGEGREGYASSRARNRPAWAVCPALVAHVSHMQYCILSGKRVVVCWEKAGKLRQQWSSQQASLGGLCWWPM